MAGAAAPGLGWDGSLDVHGVEVCVQEWVAGSFYRSVAYEKVMLYWPAA